MTDLETDRQTYQQEQWCVSFRIIDITARLGLSQGIARQSWIPVSRTGSIQEFA